MDYSKSMLIGSLYSSLTLSFSPGRSFGLSS